MPYAPLISDDEIATALEGLPAWRREDDTITRTLGFPSFRAAIEFVDRLAELAESADHHPDIEIRWRTVRLTLTTKASHGLTRRDIELAAQIEGVAGDG